MKIDFAMLASSIEYEGTEPDRSLTIKGIRHAFLAPTVPIMEKVTIISHFTINALDRGKLCEAVGVLVDQDGKRLLDPFTIVSFDFPSDYPYLTGSDIATTSTYFNLPSYGRYSFDIFVDNQLNYQLPFYVHPRPAGY